jgi:hypothetical protein
MEAQDQVSLTTLARGGAIERFDDELRRVLENIMDPNTGIGKRSVTVTVVLKPAEDKRSAVVSIACTSKVQGAEPTSTMLFIGRANGKAAAMEHNPEQMAMAFKDKTEKIPFQTAERGR